MNAKTMSAAFLALAFAGCTAHIRATNLAPATASEQSTPRLPGSALSLESAVAQSDTIVATSIWIWPDEESTQQDRVHISIDPIKIFSGEYPAPDLIVPLNASLGEAEPQDRHKYIFFLRQVGETLTFVKMTEMTDIYAVGRAIQEQRQSAAADFDASGAVKKFLAQDDAHQCVTTILAWDNLDPARKAKILNALAGHLNATAKRPLKNAERAGIVVNSRAITGEMRAGPGMGITAQDFFIEGGKAAWAIENLIGGSTTDAEIIENMTPKDREIAAEQLKQQIGIYRKGLQDAQIGVEWALLYDVEH